MKCPHCKKSTSDIGIKCVHCGKELYESIKRSNDVPVKCPLCNIHTEIIDLAGVELDYCYKCSGIWFDKGEIKKFQNAVSDQNLCNEMAKTLEDLSYPIQNKSRDNYLNCPVCSQLMSHKKFEVVSGVILDKCAEHGTWIEQEDLAEIIEIIGSGKIEELVAKAARHNQQKLDTRLKKIEAKLSSQNIEILRVKLFAKIHFFLDFLGFT